MAVSEDVLSRVRQTLIEYTLVSPGQTVLVAVSGGADSVCLLYVLHQIAPDWSLNLVVAHLNHGFRGAEAEADAAYVQTLADTLNLPCHTKFVDVPALKKARHLSAQEAAREARHTFLRETAATCGAERIALGHTADDRIETILLNLLRGTGLEGLGGFPPAALPLIRPLYNVRRTETTAYCTEHNLQPRTDSSNLKTDYARNRVRAELLPLLTSYYNQEAESAILRMAELATADNTLLNDLTTQVLPTVLSFGIENAIEFYSDKWLALPTALRRRTLRKVIEKVRGTLVGISFALTERVAECVQQGKKFGLNLPRTPAGQVRIKGDGLTFQIYLVPAEPKEELSPWEWEVKLTIPGETELPSSLSGGVLEAAIVLPDALQNDFSEKGVLYFCLDTVTLPLVARTWRPGDRIRLRNMNGRKKLQDLFTDRQLPGVIRHLVPIIAEAGGEQRILAVLGVRASSLARTYSEAVQEGKPLLRLFTPPCAEDEFAETDGAF